jgi:hypothetical protein
MNIHEEYGDAEERERHVQPYESHVRGQREQARRIGDDSGGFQDATPDEGERPAGGRDHRHGGGSA